MSVREMGIFQDPKQTQGFSSLPLLLTCLSHPHLPAFLSLLAAFQRWLAASASAPASRPLRQSVLAHTGTPESPAGSLWPVSTPWPPHMTPSHLIPSVNPPDSVTLNVFWPHFSPASLKSGLTFLPSVSSTLFLKLTQRPPFWSMNN